MQSEDNSVNSKEFPFSKLMMESFADIMRGAGFTIENVNQELLSKAFKDDKLYNKIVEVLNMRKEIIETQLNAVKAMFLYHHFGGDTFIVSHRVIGKDVEAKIKSYDTDKNKVTIFVKNSRMKDYSMSVDDFKNIVVKRVDTIK